MAPCSAVEVGVEEEACRRRETVVGVLLQTRIKEVALGFVTVTMVRGAGLVLRTRKTERAGREIEMEGEAKAEYGQAVVRREVGLRLQARTGAARSILVVAEVIMSR